jgi:hypothetical protein
MGGGDIGFVLQRQQHGVHQRAAERLGLGGRKAGP